MTRMIVVSLLVLAILGFAATGFQAPAPVGVSPLQCNQGGGATTALGTTNCGSYTCPNDGSCCGSNTCCPSGYNLYCSNNNKCYNTVAGAQSACGNSYYICSVPAR